MNALKKNKKNQNRILNKVVAVVGPTASGKTDLAVSVAGDFSGELISADSRQVYKKLDIGTAKELHLPVPQHLIDVRNAGDTYSVADFMVDAKEKLGEIWDNNHLPIIVGGTMLYVSALVEGYVLPASSLQPPASSQFLKYSNEELRDYLNEIDPDAAEAIDLKNRRRVERAITLALAGSSIRKARKRKPEFESLVLGIDLPREELYTRINIRVDRWLEQGIIEEVKHLLASGVPPEWLHDVGLEYRIITEWLQSGGHEQSKTQMVEAMKAGIRQYAKRQMTWWRSKDYVIWVKNYKEAKLLVDKFLD